MAQALQGKVTVVTGASGFVGAELVKQLLAAGATVRATVRGNPDGPRAQSLRAKLPADQLGSLSFHSADLLQPGSFDQVVQGADYVFHVASPFQVVVPNPETDLLRPALEGTRNVMDAVVKAKSTVKRVVLTSSCAAVHDCHCKQAPSRSSGLYSEDDFNNTSTPKDEPYWYSKVSAEQAAWSIARESGVDLVTILPEFVMGPVLTRDAADTSLSVEFFKGFLQSPGEGAKAPSGAWIFADVREVAAAHILAATNPSASGRYIVASNPAMDAKAVSDTLKAHFTKLDLVDAESGKANFNLDNTKAPKELGLKLRPVTETIVDMAQSLIDLGVANPKSK